MVEPTQKMSLQRLMLISAIVIASTGVVFGFALGRYQGIKSIGASPAEVKELRRKDAEHETLVDSLTDRINTTKLERDVALSSIDEAKKTTLIQQEALDDNARLIDAYRQVISARGGLDLNVQQFKIKPLPENAFEYQLDLSYVHGGHITSGNVAIKLAGSNGQELIVPMPKTNFSFSYMERLTGQWTMPASFVPQFVDIKITQGDHIFNQRYAWKVGAVIPDMPDTLLEYQESKMLKSAANVAAPVVAATSAPPPAQQAADHAKTKQTTEKPITPAAKGKSAHENHPTPSSTQSSTHKAEVAASVAGDAPPELDKHEKEHQKNLEKARADKANADRAKAARVKDAKEKAAENMKQQTPSAPITEEDNVAN